MAANLDRGEFENATVFVTGALFLILALSTWYFHYYKIIRHLEQSTYHKLMFVTIQLCCLTFVLAACFQVAIDNDLKQDTSFSRGQAVFMGLFYALTWGFANVAMIMFCTKLWLLARKIESVTDDKPDDT